VRSASDLGAARAIVVASALAALQSLTGTADQPVSVELARRAEAIADELLLGSLRWLPRAVARARVAASRGARLPLSCRLTDATAGQADAVRADDRRRGPPAHPVQRFAGGWSDDEGLSRLLVGWL
jgi:hypothetical protein